MSLIPLSSQLTPASKIGELLFWNDLTETIQSASFSRVNIDATSGTTVFNSSGNLVELAENEPAWNFPLDGGCPHLLLRESIENQVNNFDEGGWGAQGSNLGTKITDNQGPYGSFNYFQYNRTSASWVSSIRYTQSLVSTPHIRDIYAKYIDVQYLSFITSGSQINLSVDLLNKNISTLQITQNLMSVNVEDIGNDWVHIKLFLSDSGAGFYMSLNSVSNQLTNNTVNNIGSCYLSMPQQTETDYYVGKVISGTTRPADSFTLTDLISKNMVDTNGMFTYTANILWKDRDVETDILRFQNSGGTDQLTLRSKVGGNLVLTYYNGTSLVEVGSGVPENALSNIGITYDETTLIFSVGGITDVKINVDLDVIDQLICPSSNRYIEFHNKLYTAFSPFFISEDSLNFVTSNSEVLSAFSQQYKVPAPSYFGVDAICIENNINKLKLGDISMYSEAANYVNLSEDSGYTGSSKSLIRKYLIGLSS